MCALRYLGFCPEDLGTIPAAALQYVAEQVDAEPGGLAEYGERRQARAQKFRVLDRTSRLPRDWVADAAPNSVKNIHIARGRRASNASAKSKS